MVHYISQILSNSKLLNTKLNEVAQPHLHGFAHQYSLEHCRLQI